MATPISPSTSSSSNNQWIYSFSDASSSQLSVQTNTYTFGEQSTSSVNVVTPTNFTQNAEPTERNQDETTQHHLLSQLQTLKEQSSHQNLQYERAIRRALLENEYVRKINARLVANLQALGGGGDMKSSLQSLESVVCSSKDFIRELDGAKRNAEERARELEGRNGELLLQQKSMVDVSGKHQREMNDMRNSHKEQEEKLKEMEATSQEKAALLSELRDSLHDTSRNYNKLRIELNTVLGERENALLQVERLAMEKDDDVLRRIDAEAALAKSKRELMELRERLDALEVDAVVSSGEVERDEMGMVLERDSEWEAKLNAIKSAMEQATSQHASEMEALEREKEELQIRLESKMEESVEWEAKLKVIMTAMEQASSDCVMEAEEEANRNASEIGKLTEQNEYLRKQLAHLHEQVTMLRGGLQDFVKIRNAVTDITTERDMLVLKLEDISVENEASDLLVLSMTKQIGDLKANLEEVSAKNEESRLELMAANKQVEELQNALTMSTQKLEEADVFAVSLRARLEDAEEEIEELMIELNSVSEERDALNDCVEDMNATLREIVKQHRELSEPTDAPSSNLGSSNNVSADVENDAKLHEANGYMDSMEPGVNTHEHASIMFAVNSAFRSLQYQNNKLQIDLAEERKQNEERCVEMAKLEASTHEEVGSLRVQLSSTKEERNELLRYIDEMGSELGELAEQHNAIPIQSTLPAADGQDDACEASSSEVDEAAGVHLKSLPVATKPVPGEHNQRTVIDSVKSFVQLLQSQNADMETSLAHMRNSSDVQCEQLSKLETENSQLKLRNQSLLTEIEDKSTKCDHIQLRLDQTSEAAIELNQQLLSKISALETEVHRQKTDRQDIDIVMSSLQHDKQNAIALVSDLKDQLCKVKESAALQNNQLQERVHMLEVDRKLMFANKQEVLLELNSTMDKFVSMEQSLEDERQSNVNVRMQLTNLKTMLDASLAVELERSKEIQQLKEQNAELNNKLRLHCQAEEKLGKTIKLLEKEMNDYKIGLLTVSDQVNSQKEDIKRLIEQVASQKEEIKMLSHQNDEANDLVACIQSQIKSLCVSNGALPHGDPSCDEMIQMLKTHHLRQLDVTKSIQLELEATQDENAVLEEQVHILSTEVSKCRRENKELLYSLAELRRV